MRWLEVGTNFIVTRACYSPFIHCVTRTRTCGHGVKIQCLHILNFPQQTHA